MTLVYCASTDCVYLDTKDGSCDIVMLAISADGECLTKRVKKMEVKEHEKDTD